MAKKSKLEPTDGFGPKERQMVHKAVRQVWSWTRAWRLAKARALGKDGFPRCEQCKKRVPHVSVDHINPVGEVGGPKYIQKMFVPSDQLQCLCKKCHQPKTNAERKARAKRVKVIKDF